jgi:hypothetical protein
MDLLDAFKSEVFKPLATLVVPGAVAVSPYLVLAVHENPDFTAFWTEHPNYVAGMVAIAALAAGFILEDLGSRLESGVWDELIEMRTGVHAIDWHRYMAKEYEKDRQPVGQDFLLTMLTRLKFELSFAFAIVIAWIGVTLMEFIFTPRPWKFSSFVLCSFIVLVGAACLFVESYGSAWALAEVRHMLVNHKRLEIDKQAAPSAMLFTNAIVLIIAAALFLGPLHRYVAGAVLFAAGIVLGVGSRYVRNASTRVVRTVAYSLMLLHFIGGIVLAAVPRGADAPPVIDFVCIALAGAYTIAWSAIALRQLSDDATP